MNLLLAGELALHLGTGYSTIIENVARELADLGHRVTVLAEHWDRTAHHYPFQVIPTNYAWFPMHVAALEHVLDIDHTVIAMDIPKILSIRQAKAAQAWTRPVSGLFPVESSPLLPAWAAGLRGLHRRFVISEFGCKVLQDEGLESRFVPMTANVRADPLNRVSLGEVAEFAVIAPEATPKGCVMLTVGDNTDRKALPTIAEAVSVLRADGWDVVWLLLTKVSAQYGWDVRHVLDLYGIADITYLYEGVRKSQLEALYRAADVFVLASQAEGACLPLYEAMSYGLPCVAPSHTAIVEALEDGRGRLVETFYQHLHPWGNTTRYHVTPNALAIAIDPSVPNRDPELVDYIHGRSWRRVAEIIDEELRDGQEE